MPKEIGEDELKEERRESTTKGSRGEEQRARERARARERKSTARKDPAITANQQ